MDQAFINNSFLSIDRIFQEYDWLHAVTINDYSILMGVWNIFLILIPFLIALFLQRYYDSNKFRRKSQKTVAGAAFLLWLLFLPNAAYLMTDIRNLLGYCPVDAYKKVCVGNAWMIMLFFTYSLIGWAAFVLLINQMRKFLARVYTPTMAWVFVVVIIPLIALGVLLGLVHRFNSWALFTQPVNLFQSLKQYFSAWIYARNWLIFTAFFYILYFIGHKIIKPFDLR
ncbi:MAG TPA: DUF1361 domain-containing protein [Patescibacteria group bacterium]|nr:DUF1361 domain-containing protein [Patescibacteria group bacterium]